MCTVTPTFDCWVILINEVTLNELDSQRRLSNTWVMAYQRLSFLHNPIFLTATPDNYELVLSQKLSLYFVGP